MSVAKDMADTFSAIKNKDPAITKTIEAVMLHIRAREMITQDRKHIVLSILVGLIARTLIGSFNFLSAPYFRPAVFFLCISTAAAAFFISPFFEFKPWPAAVSTYLIVYLLSDFKGSVTFFRKLLIDLVDLLMFGTLTKSFATLVKDAGENGAELLLSTANKWYQPTPIAYHFYESRHPARRNRRLAQYEAEFLNLAVERPSDEIALEECRRYWRERK